MYLRKKVQILDIKSTICQACSGQLSSILLSEDPIQSDFDFWTRVARVSFNDTHSTWNFRYSSSMFIRFEWPYQFEKKKIDHHHQLTEKIKKNPAPNQIS